MCYYLLPFSSNELFYCFRKKIKNNSIAAIIIENIRFSFQISKNENESVIASQTNSCINDKFA